MIHLLYLIFLWGFLDLNGAIVGEEQQSGSGCGAKIRLRTRPWVARRGQRADTSVELAGSQVSFSPSNGSAAGLRRRPPACLPPLEHPRQASGQASGEVMQHANIQQRKGKAPSGGRSAEEKGQQEPHRPQEAKKKLARQQPAL